MEISKSVTLKTTPDNLWIWLTEMDKLQQWNPSIVKEELISDGPARSGFLSKMLLKEGNKEVWYDSEILTYQPTDLLIIQLSGGSLGKSPMRVEYELKNLGEKVQLTYRNFWKPVGFFLWLMHPIIKSVSAKSIETSLGRLKECIDQNQAMETFA